MSFVQRETEEALKENEKHVEEKPKAVSLFFASLMTHQ